MDTKYNVNSIVCPDNCFPFPIIEENGEYSVTRFKILINMIEKFALYLHEIHTANDVKYRAREMKDWDDGSKESFEI